MIVRKVEPLEDKAEGKCVGIPYNTELASSNGVSIHFWMGNLNDKEAKALAEKALMIARRNRDVVSASWSHGDPTSFWANQDMN
jgi:hypothetical protein